MSRLIYIVIFLSLVVCGDSRNDFIISSDKPYTAAAKQAAIDVVRNLQYNDHANNTKLYDKYFSNSRKTKAVILLHSGALITGSRKNHVISKLARDIARGDRADCFTIDYQLISRDINVLKALEDSKKFASQHISKSVADLNQAILQIAKEYQEVYIVGYSAGAIVANTYAFENSCDKSKIKGIASIAGGIVDQDLVADSDITFDYLLFHGTKDRMVPFAYDRPFEKYVGEKKLSLDFFYLDIGVEINEDKLKASTDWGLKIPKPYIRSFVNHMTPMMCGSACISGDILHPKKSSLFLFKNGDHSLMTSSKGVFNKNYEFILEQIIDMVSGASSSSRQNSNSNKQIKSI